MDAQAEAEWKRKLQLYPSLKKFEELGDDCVEFNDGREQLLISQLRANASSLQNKPQAILNFMDDFSFKTDFLISIGPDKTRVLAPLLTSLKPRKIVEFGAYLGYSAVFFALTLQQAGVKDLKIWSIEADETFAAMTKEVVALAGFQDVVEVVHGKSIEALKELLKKEKELENGVDLLFLDHVEELYLDDFNAAKDLGCLKKGSVVLADNVVRPGAPEYVKYVRSLQRVKSEGIRGLIMPGEMEDELEVTTIL